MNSAEFVIKTRHVIVVRMKNCGGGRMVGGDKGAWKERSETKVEGAVGSK